MCSKPVQFSLFEDPRARDNDEDKEKKLAANDGVQLSFDFMLRGAGDQEPRDLQQMRM